MCWTPWQQCLQPNHSMKGQQRPLWPHQGLLTSSTQLHLELSSSMLPGTPPVQSQTRGGKSRSLIIEFLTNRYNHSPGRYREENLEPSHLQRSYMHRGHEQAELMDQHIGGWNQLPQVNTLELILSSKPNGIFFSFLFTRWQKGMRA